MLKRSLFIIIVFTSCLVQAQTLYHVQATAIDNKSKEVEKLLHISKKNIAGMEAVLRLRDSISVRLLKNAYYLSRFVQLDLDSSKNIINLYYKAGKKFQWIDLESGNCNEAALSKSHFRRNKYTNKPFSSNEIKLLFNGIITFYENHGYPFASIKLDSINLNQGKLSAQLNVQSNQLYRVDSIIIKGDVKINPRYIYNYIGVQPGDVYDESVIRKIGQQLNNLPFLKEKKQYEMVFLKDKAKLYLYLEKQRADEVNAIIGFLPDNNTGKIRFTGQAKLKLQNAFKRGELLSFDWENLQKKTQSLDAHINYPFLFNLPFGIDYNINIYKKDSSYIEVGNRIGLSYLFTGDRTITFFVNLKSSSLLNPNLYENAVSLPSYADIKHTAYGINFHFQQLNYRYNPTKGFLVDLSVSIGKKTIFKNPVLDAYLYDSLKLRQLQYQLNGEFQYYIHLSPLNTIKLENKTALINSNGALVSNELFRIGGINTLRGFDDESILASFYSIQTLEYHFLLEQNSYLYLFADYAFYNNFSKDAHISDQPFSFGPGIAFSTNAGVFSINYALGKQKGNPILLKNGKVHFGFVSRF